MITSRRQLFGRAGRVAAAAALPGWMPRLAFRRAGVDPRGDILVCIFLRGGVDGLSAVVPYQERQYYELRKAIAFKAPTPGDAKSVIRLDDRFGLNPGLGGLRAAWDAGRLAVLQAVGSPDSSRSHFEAMDMMERGTPGQKSLSTGWIGRHLAETARATDSPFRAIGMGSLLQQSLRGPVPAASMQSIADFHLQGREADMAAFRRSLEALYRGGDWFDQDAQATLEALDLLERADPARHAPENGAQYPQTAFAQSLKQVAQLIKADVGLEVACVDMGGWDTHVNQVWANYNDPTRGQMFNLLSQLGDALAAFHLDMGTRWETPGITLVTMSEFGRRVAQNGANGTDHGHGNFMFVLGGGAVGGVHTDWPGLEPEDLDDGDLAVTMDYRDVLAEIVALRLGNPRLARVFPGHNPTLPGIVRARPDAPAPQSQRLWLPHVMR